MKLTFAQSNEIQMSRNHNLPRPATRREPSFTQQKYCIQNVYIQYIYIIAS